MLRAEPQYYGTYVAFDCMKAQTEFLNEDEFKILNYLRTKATDIEEVAAKTQISHRKCAKFLKRATACGLIKEGSVEVELFPSKSIVANPVLFARFPVPFLSTPSSVDIFVTSRCNLRCNHCFSTTRAPDDLQLERLKSILDQLEQMRVLEVRVNGGEPLLHPSIMEILQILEHRPFRKVMVTNGTLLSDEIAKQLKKSNIIPTVSLDDSDASGHDKFRGVEGVFEKTVAGLNNLQNNKVQYGINCCLHSKNLNKIESIVKLVADHGACRIAFLDLKLIGRMKKSGERMLSRREYEAALPSLMAVKSKYKMIDVPLDGFLSCPVMSESILEAKRGYISCRAGITSLSIFSDGWVYPCNSVVGEPKWRMGNSENQDLTDVWLSEKWAFFRGGVKISDLWKCRGCKERKKCRDFYCRLIPYGATGDPFGPSPNCRST